jgi:DNA-binding MarR family transcriptional regulator
LSHVSAPPFLVLHVLRLKGFAEGDVIARATGMPEDDATAHCKEMVDGGLVSRRDGKLSGWSLTPQGRQAHAEQASAELDAVGCRDVVDAAYRRFLTVNGDMLGTCTAWQLRDEGGVQVVNDHSDPAWDAAVIDRLQGLDAAVRPVLEPLCASLARYCTYEGRFTTALAKVLAGEREWFTKPVIDSYHTVWFELHEDLLSTLGIARASEAQH